MKASRDIDMAMSVFLPVRHTLVLYQNG